MIKIKIGQVLSTLLLGALISLSIPMISYAATYNGKYYYDYRVAQHTSNYHLWTSNSGNGWENIEDSRGMYGVLNK